MQPLVLSTTENHITRITLNDPEKRNPISDPPMVEALTEALTCADNSPETRVIILTGAGKAFCTGGNLKNMLPPGGLADTQPVVTPRNYITGIQRIPMLFERLQKPVIAAVNGAAVGAGCDLACMCDIRIAAKSAVFAESFVKLGLIPGDGGAWLLQRVVGYSKAAEMALTGDTLDAQDALACGLVSHLVADDQLLDTAVALAQKIAANPPHAVRMTKRLLMEGRQSNLASLLELSASMQALAHTTADHREAVNAFLEKRKPDFKGS